MTTATANAHVLQKMLQPSAASASMRRRRKSMRSSPALSAVDAKAYLALKLAEIFFFNNCSSEKSQRTHVNFDDKRRAVFSATISKIGNFFRTKADVNSASSSSLPPSREEIRRWADSFEYLLRDKRETTSGGGGSGGAHQLMPICRRLPSFPKIRHPRSQQREFGLLSVGRRL